MSDKPVFLYAAIYDEIADAEADYEAVFDLHDAGAIGTFDSAVIRKEDDGKVRVTKTEKPTQHGAWTGAGVGALVGLSSRPRSSAAHRRRRSRRLVGHLSKGISRGDLKDLGQELDAGTAAVIVLGESKIEEQLDEGAETRQQADREAGRRRRRGAQARDRRRGQGRRGLGDGDETARPMRSRDWRERSWSSGRGSVDPSTITSPRLRRRTAHDRRIRRVTPNPPREVAARS